MKILLCNERFLFRFGVDRVLILLGKSLKDLGHAVYVAANQFDINVIEDFANKIIEVPRDQTDYLNLNEFTRTWFENSWFDYFDNNSKPDIVIVCGWPFFTTIEFFEKNNCKTIFIDCGAVPLYGYEGGALIVQKKVRDLRKNYLKNCSLIIAISDFILHSQSIKDTRELKPITSVLLSANHIEKNIWESNIDRREVISKLLKKFKKKKIKIILNLGRWESGCYKNSEAIYKIVDNLKLKKIKFVILILNDINNSNIPENYNDCIHSVGFPNDSELISIIKQSDMGISVSLWEGFNLPIAEMQWFNKPVLAFNVAAHPEVILHPWYLCDNINEMIEKIIMIFHGNTLNDFIIQEATKRFHDYFTVDRFIGDYLKIFNFIIDSNEQKQLHTPLINIKTLNVIIDVTNSAIDPANTGVIRVARRLSRTMQNYINPLFVVWDSSVNSYVFPNVNEYNQLGKNNGPLLFCDAKISSNEKRLKLDEIINLTNRWLILPELINEKTGVKIRNFARNNKMQIAAVFYDSIPLIHPELCNQEVIDNHSDYMSGISNCDIIIPISQFSADCLLNFWDKKKTKGCNVVANLLPGEFGGAPRKLTIQAAMTDVIKIVCVSTLEPRKNHKKLIQACLLIDELHPSINWSLTLIGNKYAGVSDISDYIEEITKINTKIQWLGVVDDETLARYYSECSFTVYPSLIEGFGMPILESIWHGKPCICNQEGVMLELADEGGCLTVDVKDEKKLADAILRLATDKDLLTKLSQEAISRKIKTWDDYTAEYLSLLKQNSNHGEASMKIKKGELDQNLEKILYPECLCENWQMNHSERLSLAGVLSRLMPRCSIEIGTFKGGSLSLLSQFSEFVFSIDIDPEIPDKFSHFSNVSFFTGPSDVVLPLLIKELDQAGISVDFVLIDGDHSAEGIKRDINIILSYIPLKPFILMMHDGFNPECRRGMLEANWETSPYAHWVDLDFIPGRLTEHGGGGHGELWGGLGLAYFSHIPRSDELNFNVSANSMHNVLKKINIKDMNDGC